MYQDKSKKAGGFYCPSKSPDGGAVDKNKSSSGSSKVEGQNKGTMSQNLSPKSSFGKALSY